MNRNVRLLFAPSLFNSVKMHLFPGDLREHAGILLCGWYEQQGKIVLTVKEFRPARHGIDYTVTADLHGRLEPLFIDDALCAAKEQKLAYIAIHNHLSDLSVEFSRVDMASHEYGYPTLSRLNSSLPVGAAVFGKNSIEVDIWMPDGTRHQLETARVISNPIRHIWSSPSFSPKFQYDEKVDRQLPFLRNLGQGLISEATIGIVGLGGLGSQLIEPLVRLGIKKFVLIDPDFIDTSNYSRVHGALPTDLPRANTSGLHKVKIAERLIKNIAPKTKVVALPEDVAKADAYKFLLGCDFIFLAADTAAARLTCNAVAQQYYIPMLQIGTKVHIEKDHVKEVFGAVRQITPGHGCLWCNGLIDRKELADGAKSKEQLQSEAYGVQVNNPSVVTFNLEVAGRALNHFVLQYASSINASSACYDYTMIDLINGERESIEARSDAECEFCAPHLRLGVAHSIEVPKISEVKIENDKERQFENERSFKFKQLYSKACSMFARIF